MKNIKLLDCTLRDGGCVNNFNFGEAYMKDILSGLEKSKVEIIECGYIDENKGSAAGRTQYLNEQIITDTLVTEKKVGKDYVAMIDFGKFDLNNLNDRSDTSIDGLRIAFHKKDRYEFIKAGKIVLEKGYDLYVQPMTILRYSDQEILEFVNLINTELPNATAFYIVDSFGEMRGTDLLRIMNLVDHNLFDMMPIGFHSHNNLQLSYSNSVELLKFQTKRDLIFDASIMGMGKGAGNLNIELFAEHLNLFFNKEYCISPLLELIDTCLNQIRASFNWGYSIEYYLSAVHHCTPTYASYFYSKHMLSVDQVSELLSYVAEDKKVSFDAEYAQQLYYEYNSNNFNDSESIQKFKKLLTNKTVLLLAPGKSIIEYQKKISDYMEQEDVISIAVNNSYLLDTDYTLITKQNVYDELFQTDNKYLITSNINYTISNNQLIFNYSHVTNSEDKKSDNALFIILNLLRQCKINKVLLAGFDGFSSDIEENYYDDRLKRPVSRSKAEERNIRMKSFINTFQHDLEIDFITPSKYL